MCIPDKKLVTISKLTHEELNKNLEAGIFAEDSSTDDLSVEDLSEKEFNDNAMNNTAAND